MGRIFTTAAALLLAAADAFAQGPGVVATPAPPPAVGAPAAVLSGASPGEAGFRVPPGLDDRFRVPPGEIRAGVVPLLVVPPAAVVPGAPFVVVTPPATAPPAPRTVPSLGLTNPAFAPPVPLVVPSQGVAGPPLGPPPPITVP